MFKAIASFGWGTEVATLGVDFDVASSRQALFAALLPHGVLGILLGLLAGATSCALLLCVIQAAAAQLARVQILSMINCTIYQLMFPDI
eukprot:SAG31_NODE_605_length_13628_cov_24.848030_3_plen_89_part_00